MTTGGQVLISANDLVEYGAQVQHVISVIERDAMGRENLEQARLQYFSLFQMDELLAASSK
ncbi:orotate phosphoribosyltransferase [compost metagenome]